MLCYFGVFDISIVIYSCGGPFLQIEDKLLLQGVFPKLDLRLSFRRVSVLFIINAFYIVVSCVLLSFLHLVLRRPLLANCSAKGAGIRYGGSSQSLIIVSFWRFNCLYRSSSLLHFVSYFLSYFLYVLYCGGRSFRIIRARREEAFNRPGGTRD